ncbi:MAG: MFS family permease [Gammaproteobacteria bacterium]|jgi:MFS family permease
MAWSVYAPSFLVAVGQQALLIMLPLYALELGGGAGLAATFLGLNGLGRMLSALPSGAAISRFGDKRTMLGGLTLVAGAAFGLCFAQSLWLISVLALAVGAGVGAWMLARLHYIAEHCPSSHRGRAMTVLAGLHRLGALLGPVLGGIVAHYMGYPVLFAGAGALAIIGFVLVVHFTLRAHAPALRSHQALPALAKVVAEHKGVFATAGTATIAMQFVRAGRQLLLPLWGHQIGLDAAQIGFVFSASSAIDVCMFYPAGYIMDYWGRKWAMTMSLVGLGAALAMLPLTDSFYSYLCVALLSGLGNGFGTGVIMTIGADLSPQEHRGEFLGVWRLIGDLGSAVGPFLMGAVAHAFALTGALFLNAFISGVGATIMITLVKETLRRGMRR